MGKNKIINVQGQKTISEITSEYEVYPNQVSQWKRQQRLTAVTVKPVIHLRLNSSRKNPQGPNLAKHA